MVLTMDDLSQALGDHGVNVKKPDYCKFRVAPSLTQLTGRLVTFFGWRTDVVTLPHHTCNSNPKTEGGLSVVPNTDDTVKLLID